MYYQFAAIESRYLINSLNGRQVFQMHVTLNHSVKITFVPCTTREPVSHVTGIVQRMASPRLGLRRRRHFDRHLNILSVVLSEMLF